MSILSTTSRAVASRQMASLLERAYQAVAADAVRHGRVPTA